MRFWIVAASILGVLAWGIWLGRAPERARRLRPALIALTAVASAAWLVLAALAPEDAVQGIIQKIFYAHVPAVAPTYLAFALTAICGAVFLQTREVRWDHVARASAEVGVVFCTLILIVGPLWAKPAWGHWWVWDLRLTSTLVLWFIYVAYLFVRALTYGSDAARNSASILGIVGALAVPFVYKAVDLARGDTLHPSNPADQGLPAGMAWAITAGLVAFVLWAAVWIDLRSEIAALEHAEELRLADAHAAQPAEGETA